MNEELKGAFDVGALKKSAIKREAWNENREWWEPSVYGDGDEYFQCGENCEIDEGLEVGFLCDHVGDASEKMLEMWKEIIRLRSILNERRTKISV